MVEADDGHFYVAKFLGNPQGNRTLVNEWIVYRLLVMLGVSTPDLRVLVLPSPLQVTTGLSFLVGNRRIPPEGNLHLGSQCPVDPERTAIFDFLPRRMLTKIVNLDQFATMFVFDRWVSLADRRQAVFVRDFSQGHKFGFRAYFIDHGMSFSGKQWELLDTPAHGLVWEREIYSLIDLRLILEAVVSRIEGITKEIIFAAAQDIPATWLGPGDQECLRSLFGNLHQRQSKLRYVVARHLEVLRGNGISR